jgi:chromosome segregation and condensation protein ScpB
MQRNETKKDKLKVYAEVMELFYAGDPIRISTLARQLGIDKSDVRKILMKYYPQVTGRYVVMLIGSKLNDEWGQGDYKLKQEGSED